MLDRSDSPFCDAWLAAFEYYRFDKPERWWSSDRDNDWCLTQVRKTRIRDFVAKLSQMMAKDAWGNPTERIGDALAVVHWYQLD